MRSPVSRSAERGVTMLVVLVLMSVMLLGALALARLTEVGTLATGNMAYHEAAMQASEVGVNTAFVAVQGIANEDTSVGAWYSSTEMAKDSNGLPAVNWDAAPLVTVGTMNVRYYVERACTVTPVVYALRQCLVKQIPQPKSRVAGVEELDPPNSKQYRITVRVTDQKGTQTFVQSLVTKG